MVKSGIGAGNLKWGAGGKLLSSVGDDEETTSGENRIVAEAREVAIETCALRMSKLHDNEGVSRGISFGIDQEPSGPKSSWSIVLHRGPPPLLQVELSDMSGFRPPPTWFNTIVKSDCGHILHKNSQSLVGRGDFLFLMLKRWELFPYSKAKATSEAVAAGQRLRQWCAEVWKSQGDSKDFLELSNWQWRRKRFVRNFDQMLLAHTGLENLNKTLREMGTHPEVWFHSHH